MLRFLVSLLVGMALTAPTSPYAFASESAEETPPLRVAKSDSYGYSRAWTAVLNEADIVYEKIAVPQKRKRRLFVEGAYILDCCITPLWRNRPEEHAVQLFTAPLHQATIHYIFKKGQIVTIENPQQLRSMRVATIIGFNYLHDDLFGTTLPVGTVDATFQLVESGRANLTIISKNDFLQHMAIKPRPLELGGIHNRVPIVARVHKSRADLLPRLNAAIARLQENGDLQALMATPSPQ